MCKRCVKDVEKLTFFAEKAVLFLIYLRICAKRCNFVVGFVKCI